MDANGSECGRINTWYGSSSTKGGAERRGPNPLQRADDKSQLRVPPLRGCAAPVGMTAIRDGDSDGDEGEIVSGIAAREHPMREHPA